MSVCVRTGQSQVTMQIPRSAGTTIEWQRAQGRRSPQSDAHSERLRAREARFGRKALDQSRRMLKTELDAELDAYFWQDPERARHRLDCELDDYMRSRAAPEPSETQPCSEDD